MGYGRWGGVRLVRCDLYGCIFVDDRSCLMDCLVVLVALDDKCLDETLLGPSLASSYKCHDDHHN